MRNSWCNFFRRLARVFLVTGATAWSSAICYAQVAADSAFDPVYADGWQAGDNGGFGFGPWDFSGTETSVVQQTIDSSAPYNFFGKAWTLFNADAPPGPGSGTDISQAGRSIVGGLQPGQTVSIMVASPLQRRFFRGYSVRFNTGAGNTVYAGTPISRLAIGTFEYFTNGKWFATGTGGDPTLFDIDTYEGLRIDFTLTGANTFDLAMTALNDNPVVQFTKSGTLDGPVSSTIDWIEFEMFNTDSDFYPIAVPFPEATDFYVASMTIVPEPGGASLSIVGIASILAAARARKRQDE